MTRPARNCFRNLATHRQTATVALMLTLLFVLTAAPAARAQTYQVIHNFTGGPDGSNPLGRLSIDGGGHLYGATYGGGIPYDGGFGVVFRMSPKGSGWTFSSILTFTTTSDGGDPDSGVAFGPGGLLYGTTSNGGTVFTLAPSPTFPRTVFAPWAINWLYSFPLHKDAPYGDLAFDSVGNIYGVTATGGSNLCFDNQGCGMVYELTPTGGPWLLTILYIFQGGADGAYPAGVTLDAAGNLVGTAANGGTHDDGVIFQLTPGGNGWTESVLYNFDCNGHDGCIPQAGLVSDAAGNLYGSTASTYPTIFEFSPSKGGWTYTVLANVPPQYQTGPTAPLTMDAAGNLYGTLGTRDNYELTGAVFEVTHGNSGWTFTSLHDFTGGNDGAAPSSTVAMDGKGNLYGTAIYGGPNCRPVGCGVVWEITP